MADVVVFDTENVLPAVYFIFYNSLKRIKKAHDNEEKILASRDLMAS